MGDSSLVGSQREVTIEEKTETRWVSAKDEGAGPLPTAETGDPNMSNSLDHPQISKLDVGSGPSSLIHSEFVMDVDGCVKGEMPLSLVMPKVTKFDGLGNAHEVFDYLPKDKNVNFSNSRVLPAGTDSKGHQADVGTMEARGSNGLQSQGRGSQSWAKIVGKRVSSWANLNRSSSVVTAGEESELLIGMKNEGWTMRLSFAT